MDFGILSFVGAGNDASSPSTGSLFSFSSPELWRRSDSDPVRPFRLEPGFKPKPAFGFQRSAHDAAASFSISFNSPPALDFYKQGYGCGGSTDGMHSPFTRCRDPFTPSQWLDLQLQALIYKYIVTNMPVPSSLLFQIRKSLDPFLFVGSSSGSYAPNSFGWGPFHLGLSGSNDPEPGRCRRTDGKKWRCSKEAVPDQKYCERHLNRGRHRSRKPVEDRKGQVVAGTINTKEMPTDSSPSASVLSSNGTSKSLGLLQILPLMLLLTVQEWQGMSIQSPTLDLKSEDTPPSITPHVRTDGSSQTEFGIVPSTSLLYSSDKGSYNDPRNRHVFLRFNDREIQNPQPLHRFMDDWPKNQSDRLTLGWPDEFKSDWTRLSMSIPMNSSTFSPYSNSPREKFTLTPLSIPCELDTADMSLALPNNQLQKQTSWNPVNWENSMGGPLGEVLNSTSSSVEASRSSLVLNLRNTEVLDGRSQLGSSPTGVLQKATIVSVSNSSTGSSQRAGNIVGCSSLPDHLNLINSC